MTKTAFFTALLLMAVSEEIRLYAEEPPALRIEGIMYDAAKPEQSVAVIDGELYKAGDKTGDYEVRRVNSESVELVQGASGKEITLKAEKIPEQDPGPAPGEALSVSSAEATGPAMFGRLIQKIVNSNTTLAESSCLSELKTIYAAAMSYVINDGYNDRTVDLPGLVKKGMLSRDYEDSVKGAYRFSIKVLEGGVDVQADPVEKESGLRHFLLAADGTLYYERGKSATRQSAFQNN